MAKKMKSASCGMLRHDEQGRWWYGGTQIGHDGQMYPGALEQAMGEAADAPQPELEAWKPEPRQLSFTWPVEAPSIVNVDADRTLAAAHAELWEQLDKGAFCDCCQRMARRYPRPFHREMARFLVRLVEAWEEMPANGKKYIGVRELWAGSPKASTDGSYLVLWDLVRRHPKKTGFYKPTLAGIAFVLGRTVVPKVAWVYDGRATHFSKETISITEALDLAVDVPSMLADTAGPEGR